jgi:hypothetical protein
VTRGSIDAAVLLGALDTLRSARAVSLAAAREAHGAWDTIDAYFGTACRGDRDAAQEALLTVMRSVGSFRGTSPGEALKWLQRIAWTRMADGHARRRRDPVALALRATRGPGDDGRGGPLDGLVAPDAAPDEDDGHLAAGELRARLDELRDRVFDALDMRLGASGVPAARALVVRRQARVCWQSIVEGRTSDEILSGLGADAPKRETLYKWVERGRAPLLDALQAARRDANTHGAVDGSPHDGARDAGETDEAAREEARWRARVLARVEAKVAQRRADVGRERPRRAGEQRGSG